MCRISSHLMVATSSSRQVKEIEDPVKLLWWRSDRVISTWVVREIDPVRFARQFRLPGVSSTSKMKIRNTLLGPVRGGGNLVESRPRSRTVFLPRQECFGQR